MARSPELAEVLYPLGAHVQGDGCSFMVWAPKAEHVAVHLASPVDWVVPLRQRERGYFFSLVEGVKPGAKYWYRLGREQELPDPASRFQPEGVHGPSEVIDTAFDWDDSGWLGVPLRDYLIYELHVGTFTPEGTFDAIIRHLPELTDLGVTAVELMPVGQFPGGRNWGYDAVYPYAVQNSYGGPAGLKRLVNACHQQHLAVILDVVYNHLGPEGNCLREFGPYFADRYRTPWGSALNLDGEHSQEVRRFFLDNALHWQTEFHIDALRLDAVHAIKDCSAAPFLLNLAQLARERAAQLNRRFYLIAESDLNDPRLISPECHGGYGLDAQWSDDFHHSLHVLLTGERDGYYEDFGGTGMFGKVFREGYAYTGQYSKHRRRRHGISPRLNHARQFVVFSQNHDQVGNRRQGDRLSQLTDLEGLKLAAGAVLLSPFIPLLFMGEEYGEPAPFQYVISHADPELVETVRRGRREEFAGFGWSGHIPDPQAESTFEQCILNRELLRTKEDHRLLYEFYRELIRLRRAVPAIAGAEKETVQVEALETEKVLRVRYDNSRAPVCLVFCFASEPVSARLEFGAGIWRKLLDSSSERWGGPGSHAAERTAVAGRLLELQPRSILVYQLTR